MYIISTVSSESPGHAALASASSLLFLVLNRLNSGIYHETRDCLLTDAIGLQVAGKAR